jgi:medium-chain acyl-[acyl-carrier-protein] hydrolase
MPDHDLTWHDGRAMVEPSNDAWWVVPAKKPAAARRLFCLPYAGGSGTVFHKLAQSFGDDVEVHSMQPPGRGFRMREPAYADLAGLIGGLCTAIEPRLDRPYALLGHSMGALVAFELVRALRHGGRRLPEHLFVSASPSPAAWTRVPVSIDLEPAAFWRAVNELYGTPVQSAVPADVLDLVVPPLKADLALIASYRHVAEAPLALPITALVGTRDPMVRPEAAREWAAETSRAFALHEVSGAHLFLQDAVAQLSAHVRAAWR